MPLFISFFFYLLCPSSILPVFPSCLIYSVLPSVSHPALLLVPSLFSLFLCLCVCFILFYFLSFSPLYISFTLRSFDFAFRFFAVYLQRRLIFSPRFHFCCHYMFRANRPPSSCTGCCDEGICCLL
jgi:hypothetical protein